MAKRRRTISFDEDTFEAIEEHRKKSTPIPSFNEAVIEILRKGLRVR